MDSSWKRIIYLICTIQVGGGITIIGVVSFIPLFLAELGLHDQGQAAMWAGIVSGVTPLMVALSAPYWSRKANQWGPRKVMMLILFILMITVGACAFTQTPMQLLILRILQGIVGGYVPIGLAIIVLITPEKKVPWAMGLYQASMVMGLVFGPLMGGLVADFLGYRAPFFVFAALTGICMLGIYFLMPNLQFKHKVDESVSEISLIKYFLSIPRVRLLVGMLFLCNFGITGIGPILPLYIKHYMHMSDEFVATIVGIIIFGAGLFSALASISISKVTRCVTMPRIVFTACLLYTSVQYLANLFTAGNTEILARTLQRVLDMREYMRRRETGDGPIDHNVDLTEDQMYGMYKLLALSKYNDRFVIPSDVKVSREGRLEMQQNRGFACPTGGCQ